MNVTVIGLGYIGLPTAAVLATHGHHVNGYDVRSDVIARLKRKEIHIEEPGLLAFTRDAIQTGRFVPTDTFVEADVYIICVPTPLRAAAKTADLGYIERAARSIRDVLKPGDLVILESTVPAGTTARFLVPILEESGLSCENEVLVAHCPETVLPGNMIEEIIHNDRVIGGHTPQATAAATRLYESFVRGHLIKTDCTTAEFVKLIQNTYRDVNIALANELALAGRGLGIDTREAIRIANHHPRVHLHQPGPGVGGHCIPIDPWFVVESYPDSEVVRTGRLFNDAMPERVLQIVRGGLSETSPVVALFGLTYKGNVDDIRESPAMHLLELLRDGGAGEVRAHDPFVTPDRHPVVTAEEALRGADCLLIATDHAQFRDLRPSDAKALMRTPFVVDTRGILDAEAWRAAGFRVERL